MNNDLRLSTRLQEEGEDGARAEQGEDQSPHSTSYGIDGPTSQADIGPGTNTPRDEGRRAGGLSSGDGGRGLGRLAEGHSNWVASRALHTLSPILADKVGRRSQSPQVAL
jgi:hypothetical protein